jgi:SNF2 family DNA or RNA helicase
MATGESSIAVVQLHYPSHDKNDASAQRTYGNGRRLECGMEHRWLYLLDGYMISVDKKGRRIEIRSSVPLPGLRAAIPGAYESVSGSWTVPLSMESCKLLRQKYGRQLKVGTELQRWARGVRDNRQYMAQLAAADDVELEVLPKVAPKLAEAMNKRKYQRVGVRFIADTSATLVADDPGLGKTLIALGGILEAQVPGPYLVIAPKIAARAVWAREIKWRLPREHRPITMPESRLMRERKLRLTDFHATTWLIVHPEMMLCQSWLTCQQLLDTGQICGVRSKFRGKQQRLLDCEHIKNRKTKREDVPAFKRLFDIEWGAVIIDESHESLVRRSGVPTQRRNGMDKIRVRSDGLRIAMSGTPMKGKPHQLWGTLNWLDPKSYGAFYRWVELYWQKGGKTGFEIGEFRADREQMLWDSLKAIAIRRTKAEVAKDLPPKTYVGTPLESDDAQSPVGIWLEMEGKQERAYEQMLKTSAAELDSGRLEAITALAELTRLKQLACSYGDMIESSFINDEGDREYRHRFVPGLPSNKFEWSIEMLEEWGFPDDPITKVIFASNYTSVLTMFAAGFERHFRRRPDKPLSCLVTGRNASTREAVLDRFNDDGHESIMLLNTKAGGTAITVDTADKMVFISETRDPDQQSQTEDRIHRVSNPRQCMYYYLRSLGTVDVGTALVSQQRGEETRRLLDVRRGVHYVRHILDLSR